MRNFAAALLLAPILLAGSTLAQAPVAASTPSPGVQSQNSPGAGLEGYKEDPKFKSAMKDAVGYQRERKPSAAVGALRKANKIAGGACVSCLNTMYKLQRDSGDFKGAAQTAAELAGVARNPQEKSIAELEQGYALLWQAGEKPKPAQLEAAHAVFTSAIADSPHNVAAQYEDGCVLARLGKLDEAGKQFAACADRAPAGAAIGLRARRFSANPSLALLKRAPSVQLTALDGSKFNLDALTGQVVLIDFWATWCGPCNEELPHIKKIAKEFAGEPLVILSISLDHDDGKWRGFVSKHEMTWMQYRDADNRLAQAFGVHSIPHYFTIDSDGVLTSEMMGSGSDVEGKLKKMIKRAREQHVSPAPGVTAAE